MNPVPSSPPAAQGLHVLHGTTTATTILPPVTLEPFNVRKRLHLLQEVVVVEGDGGGSDSDDDDRIVVSGSRSRSAAAAGGGGDVPSTATTASSSSSPYSYAAAVTGSGGDGADPEGGSGLYEGEVEDEDDEVYSPADAYPLDDGACHRGDRSAAADPNYFYGSTATTTTTTTTTTTHQEEGPHGAEEDEENTVDVESHRYQYMPSVKGRDDDDGLEGDVSGSDAGDGSSSSSSMAWRWGMDDTMRQLHECEATGDDATASRLLEQLDGSKYDNDDNVESSTTTPAVAISGGGLQGHLPLGGNTSSVGGPHHDHHHGEFLPHSPGRGGSGRRGPQPLSNLNELWYKDLWQQQQEEEGDDPQAPPPPHDTSSSSSAPPTTLFSGGIDSSNIPHDHAAAGEEGGALLGVGGRGASSSSSSNTTPLYEIPSDHYRPPAPHHQHQQADPKLVHGGSGTMPSPIPALGGGGGGGDDDDLPPPHLLADAGDGDPGIDSLLGMMESYAATALQEGGTTASTTATATSSVSHGGGGVGDGHDDAPPASSYMMPTTCPPRSPPHGSQPQPEREHPQQQQQEKNKEEVETTTTRTTAPSHQQHQPQPYSSITALKESIASIRHRPCQVPRLPQDVSMVIQLARNRPTTTGIGTTSSGGAMFISTSPLNPLGGGSGRHPQEGRGISSSTASASTAEEKCVDILHSLQERREDLAAQWRRSKEDISKLEKEGSVASGGISDKDERRRRAKKEADSKRIFFVAHEDELSHSTSVYRYQHRLKAACHFTIRTPTLPEGLLSQHILLRSSSSTSYSSLALLRSRSPLGGVGGRGMDVSTATSQSLSSPQRQNMTTSSSRVVEKSRSIAVAALAGKGGAHLPVPPSPSPPTQQQQHFDVNVERAAATGTTTTIGGAEMPEEEEDQPHPATSSYSELLRLANQFRANQQR